MCSALLHIPEQIENTHFGENCIIRTPLGHVWSVVEHIRQISINWSHLCCIVLTYMKCC